MREQVPRGSLSHRARRTAALRTEARRLLASLHSGSMSETAYDTAWVARVRDPTDAQALAFPSAMAWLLHHQHADGSWGATPHIVHDRVVSTLAAVIALLESPTPIRDGTVERGVAYLTSALPRLHGEAVETVGFELIMPPLLSRAAALGLDLPPEASATIDHLRADKLRRLPPGFVYAGPTSLTHSLEFLGDDFEPELARRCRAANGSYGASPSATAFVLTRQWDEEAAGYIRAVLALSGDGGACNVFPFEIFERGWVLYHLSPLARELAGFRPHVAALAAAWTPAGVGFTSQGMVPDGDDTAIVFKVLRSHGFPVHARVLKLFESDDYFFCFPLERNQSVSTNAHVVEALKGYPESVETTRMLAKAVGFLAATQIDGAFWRDKWHVSAYYATGHAVQALVGVGPTAADLVKPAVRWLIETQRPNGSWGELDPEGTSEETAYALNALALAATFDDTAAAAAQRAARYLWARLDEPRAPELWVGKGLYTPYAVVRAAVLGALHRYELSLSRREADPGG